MVTGFDLIRFHRTAIVGVCIYLFAIIKNIIKNLQYYVVKKIQYLIYSSVKMPINRKISISQMARINLIKIH